MGSLGSRSDAVCLSRRNTGVGDLDLPKDSADAVAQLSVETRLNI